MAEKPTNLDKLWKDVQSASGGVLLSSGLEIRAAAGETRLKEKARARVAEALRSIGLVAIPEVPEDQEDAVYVVRAGSDVELLFNALTHPGDRGLPLVLQATGGAKSAVNQLTALAQLRDALEEAQEHMAKIEDEGSLA